VDPVLGEQGEGFLDILRHEHLHRMPERCLEGLAIAGIIVHEKDAGKLGRLG
jgi:hypothetical protein